MSTLSTYTSPQGRGVNRRFSVAANPDARYSMSRASIDQANLQHKSTQARGFGGSVDHGAMGLARSSIAGDSDVEIEDGLRKMDTYSLSEVGDDIEQETLREIREAVNRLPQKIGEERDVEVRRRVLTSLLSIFREGYETSLVNYVHLTSLTDDIKDALDANEEGEVHELFGFFLQDPSYIPFSAVLNSTIAMVVERAQFLILRRFFRTSGRQSRIAQATMIISALKQILADAVTKDSDLVFNEIQNVYGLALGYLNRMEALSPHEYSNVQTDSVVRYVFKLQTDSLEELRKQGEIDTEECETIHHELVALQRKYLLHKRAFQRKRKLSNERILRSLPLFRPMDAESFATSVVDHGHFLKIRTGGVIKPKPGSLVVVLRGALRVSNMSSLMVSDEGATMGEALRDEHTTEPVFIQADLSSHLCFAKYSVIVPADIFAGHHREFPSVRSCEIAGPTTVFVLPGAQVQQLAHVYEWFRSELGRNIARLILLGLLADSPSYLDKPTTFDQEDSGTWSPASIASDILQSLPYSSLYGLTQKHGTAKVQGPGVLLQGKLRVTRKDFHTFIQEDDKNIVEEYTAPDILPPGLLSIELLTTEDSEEIELAELMIQDIASLDVIAEDRIRRWTGPAELIDTNGRFGINRHMDLDEYLSHQAEEEVLSAEGEVAQGDDVDENR